MLVFSISCACTQKKQYEILSPCVSAGVAEGFAMNPCVRKPINYQIA